jgi:hypothetical protein
MDAATLYPTLTISIEIEVVRKGHYIVHEIQEGRGAFLTEWSSQEDADARAEFLRALWIGRGATVH